MSIRVFDSDDQAYLNWVYRHPNAFVMLLSSHRSFETRAECVTHLLGFHINECLAVWRRGWD
jgi:hypothetical protein